MKKSLYFIVFSFVFTIVSCNQSDSTRTNEELTNIETDLHFDISKEKNFYLITVKNPFVGADFEEKYVLYPKASKKPEVEGVTHFIPLPLNKVAINSTTHLGYIQALEESNKIAAATNLNLFYSKVFNERIDSGQIQSIGKRKLDHEQLINASVDLIFTYAIDGASYSEVERMRALGQKVILVSEFMERKPLYKTQWLEFFGAFFGKIEEAKEIVDEIEVKFNKIEAEATKVKNEKSVMVGLPWQGSWYVGGGESFQASYFKSANADYIWKDIKQSGGVALTFEKVLSDAIDADYWLQAGSITSINELVEEDSRFEAFAAVKKGQLYSNYRRTNKNGANDYWESGVINADLILKDLVAIFHPEIFPDHEFVYYQKLDKD